MLSTKVPAVDYYHPVRDIAVIVPARDEAATLSQCLHSVAVAAERLRRHRLGIAVRTIVVLDSCTDESASLLRDMSGVDVLCVGVGRVGGARAEGCMHAMGQCASDQLSGLWLANTDADSIVPVNWLLEMVAAADHGSDLVLGTVEPGAELAQSVRVRWRDSHPAVENHPYVYGANFGIRAATYARLGGWSAIASGEDVELAARAELDPSVRINRTARIPVRTSGRRLGRAPGGFAAYIAALCDSAL